MKDLGKLVGGMASNVTTALSTRIETCHGAEGGKNSALSAFHQATLEAIRGRRALEKVTTTAFVGEYEAASDRVHFVMPGNLSKRDVRDRFGALVEEHARVVRGRPAVTERDARKLRSEGPGEWSAPSNYAAVDLVFEPPTKKRHKGP